MGNDKNNKQQVFDELILEHHVRVRAFVRSLGVDPDWVDDISQEAFLTAYREWSSFDQTRDFGRWVRGIAANIVRNEIRKDARRRRILLGGLTETLLRHSDERQPDKESISVEAIQECVSRLSPASQRIVHGRYREGLAAPQLAGQLQMSAANVRQSLVRIRRQLKRCVELRLKGETT